jgi:hypothetical protein
LPELEKEQLEMRIYVPFYISKGTMVHFNLKQHGDKDAQKLSIMDIL